MGFIKEIYSDNRAGLIVLFGRGENSNTYFNGDSVEAAMEYFNLYLKNNQLYVKTEDEQAIENLGIKTEDAIEFRTTIDSIIETLSDEQAVITPVLFPVWQVNIAYKKGDRVRYNGKLYKVIQEHTSQINWEPIFANSLFSALLIDEENLKILPWVQPESTNPYMENDKVIHNNKFWISTANNNVWEPDTVNAPWEEYIPVWENGVSYEMNQKVSYNEEIYVSLVTNNITVPTDSSSWQLFSSENILTPEEETDNIPEWAQPDATSAYSIGDKIIFNGVIYESLIDGNVWSPEAYPAGWATV